MHFLEKSSSCRRTAREYVNLNIVDSSLIKCYIVVRWHNLIPLLSLWAARIGRVRFRGFPHRSHFPIHSGVLPFLKQLSRYR